MLERFSKWYFGPDMEEKDQKPYLLFILVTHTACFVALFGPVRRLAVAMWLAVMLMDFFMHANKVDARFPLAWLAVVFVCLFFFFIRLVFG